MICICYYAISNVWYIVKKCAYRCTHSKFNGVEYLHRKRGMIEMKKKLISILLAIILITGSNMSFAYSISHLGIENPPMYLTCYSGFAVTTNTAIHNACLEINNAGVGPLIYRTTYTHNTTQYPLGNLLNEITKGNRGTGANVYIAQTYTKRNILLKAYEADIDINVDKPISAGYNSGTYDIQNFMTHEFLHVVGLNDLSGSADIDKTAYYSIMLGETFKRSLHQDDIDGILHIYN